MNNVRASVWALFLWVRYYLVPCRSNQERHESERDEDNLEYPRIGSLIRLSRSETILWVKRSGTLGSWILGKIFKSSSNLDLGLLDWSNSLKFRCFDLFRIPIFSVIFYRWNEIGPIQGWFWLKIYQKKSAWLTWRQEKIGYVIDYIRKRILAKVSKRLEFFEYSSFACKYISIVTTDLWRCDPNNSTTRSWPRTLIACRNSIALTLSRFLLADRAKRKPGRSSFGLR